MQKLILKLLIEIMYILMDVRQHQTGCRYSWVKERALLIEAHKALNISGLATLIFHLGTVILIILLIWR